MELHCLRRLAAANQLTAARAWQSESESRIGPGFRAFEWGLIDPHCLRACLSAFPQSRSAASPPLLLPTQAAQHDLEVGERGPDGFCKVSSRLAFVPNAAGWPTNGYMDPALQFASGGITFNFTIKAGDNSADGDNSEYSSKETVAGRITVTLTSLTAGSLPVLPAAPLNASVVVPQIAPVVESCAMGAIASGAFFGATRRLLHTARLGVCRVYLHRGIRSADYRYRGEWRSGRGSEPNLGSGDFATFAMVRRQREPAERQRVFVASSVHAERRRKRFCSRSAVTLDEFYRRFQLNSLARARAARRACIAVDSLSERFVDDIGRGRVEQQQRRDGDHQQGPSLSPCVHTVNSIPARFSTASRAARRERLPKPPE